MGVPQLAVTYTVYAALFGAHAWLKQLLWASIARRVAARPRRDTNRGVDVQASLIPWVKVTFPLPLKNFFCTLQFWSADPPPPAPWPH